MDYLTKLTEVDREMARYRHIAEHAFMRSVFIDTVAQKPNLIVEIGAREGLSTRTFCRAASLFNAAVISCDIINHKIACDYPRWYFVCEKGTAFASQFADYCEQLGIAPNIDVLCIDTTELYSEVREEIVKWFPHLSPCCTVFFFCTNLQKRLYYEDGSSTGLGWDNERGVIRAVQEHYWITFDETKEWSGEVDNWIITSKPWGGGWTTCVRK